MTGGWQVMCRSSHVKLTSVGKVHKTGFCGITQHPRAVIIHKGTGPPAVLWEIWMEWWWGMILDGALTHSCSHTQGDKRRRGIKALHKKLLPRKFRVYRVWDASLEGEVASENRFHFISWTQKLFNLKQKKSLQFCQFGEIIPTRLLWLLNYYS